MPKILIAFMMCLSITVKAYADVSFTADVHVEMSADDLAKARDGAMLKAERDAFLTVADRLTTKDNLALLNELTDEQMAHFIREISVVSENNEANTYLGDFNVTINGGLLKQYMQENGMLEALTEQAEVLILPVYSPNSYSPKIFWGQENVFRSAWLDKGMIISGVLKLNVISDTNDHKQALQENTEQAYEQLLKSSGASDLYTVQAVQAGRSALALIIKSHSQKSEKRIMVFEENGNVMDKAIAESVAYITDDMQKHDVMPSSTLTSLNVTYEYAKLKDWLMTEKTLKELPQIKSLQTGAAVNGKVVLNLEYIGSYQHLIKALENKGLHLFANNGVYILR